jgi:hypothetical protein
MSIFLLTWLRRVSGLYDVRVREDMTTLPDSKAWQLIFMKFEF